MVKPAPQQKRLRLYTEQPLPNAIGRQTEAVACLPELLRAFQAATGWPLRYGGSEETVLDAILQPANRTPVGVGRKAARRLLVLEQLPQATEDAEQKANDAERIPTPPAGVDRDAAQALAGPIAELLGEVLQTRGTLRQREAELAAGVPVVPQREGEKHLAQRLEAVLRAGAEVVEGVAAALYLLDEATTELKLRASWGLPFDRLAAPARPLQGAVADLEALLGHAVVLGDDDRTSVWNAPEEFGTAVCVPVSTPTMLLGTLWVFCRDRRAVGDYETNILEIVAGRLAADLEREMLLRAGVDGADAEKADCGGRTAPSSGLPAIAPLLDGWDVAGWTTQADGVGGAFHDWFCLPDGLLAVAVGRAAEQGVPGR